MQCPHCLISFSPEWESLDFYQPYEPDNKIYWKIRFSECPECNRTIVQIGTSGNSLGEINSYQFVYPKSVSRAPIDPDVPILYSEDYREACLVLSDSPKASAALSRRCLQSLLKEEANTTKKDLNDQIQEVIALGNIPTYLSEGLDAVRVIGNFAAHPIKSKSTGEIVEVEPGEAEWNLDIVEGLFDFFFVQPRVLKDKKEKLNKKLEDAGKPPLR
jgi:hypothetical protein